MLLSKCLYMNLKLNFFSLLSIKNNIKTMSLTFFLLLSFFFTIYLYPDHNFHNFIVVFLIIKQYILTKHKENKLLN